MPATSHIIVAKGNSKRTVVAVCFWI